ncbi:FAD/FMN-containing dehydrogenase [Paraburkholderia sp. GAS348]
MTSGKASRRNDLNSRLALQRRIADTRAEVRFDAGTRAAYASEASNYRQVPIGVVIPRCLDDVVETVRACHEADVPVLTRGAGTSMCGQSVNAAVVIDVSKYLTAIEQIDAASRTAIVQPGVICDQLKDAAAVEGLTFGPDPATHSRCTIGGMVGNNSCGAHSVMAGKTAENVESMEVLTYDGAQFWVGPTDAEILQEHLAAGGRRAEIVSSLLELVEKHGDAMQAESQLLKGATRGGSILPTGCCGMAGAYGYHSKTASLAREVAASEMVPVVHALHQDTVIVSDGFSCRSQIRNSTGRTAIHLAQWLDRRAVVKTSQQTNSMSVEKESV